MVVWATEFGGRSGDMGIWDWGIRDTVIWEIVPNSLISVFPSSVFPNTRITFVQVFDRHLLSRIKPFVAIFIPV